MTFCLIHADVFFFYKSNDDYILIASLNLNEAKSVLIDFCRRGRGVKIL